MVSSEKSSLTSLYKTQIVQLEEEVSTLKQVMNQVRRGCGLKTGIWQGPKSSCTLNTQLIALYNLTFLAYASCSSTVLNTYLKKFKEIAAKLQIISSWNCKYHAQAQNQWLEYDHYIFLKYLTTSIEHIQLNPSELVILVVVLRYNFWNM